MRLVYSNEDLDVPAGALYLYNRHDRNHITDQLAQAEAEDVKRNFGDRDGTVKHFEENLSGVAHNGHIVVIAHSDGKTLRTLRRTDARWNGTTFVDRMRIAGLFDNPVVRFYLVACNAADGFAADLYRALRVRYVPSDNYPLEVTAANGTTQVYPSGKVGVNLNWSMTFWSCFCMGYAWTTFTDDAPVPEEQRGLTAQEMMAAIV